MYDFDTLIDRTGTGASKWEMMRRKKPGVAAGVVPFSVADMDFVTAPEIRAGLKDYIDQGVLGYTNPTAAYRDAVAGWMATRHRWHIDGGWIVPSPGVVPALFHGVRTFTAPGEGVVIMPPVYYPFFEAVKHAGRRLLENPLVNVDGRYEIDFPGLEKLAARAKLLIFCSPHNPVGRVWTKTEVEKVADICLRHGVLILSDEIHFDFLFGGREHTVLADLSPEAAQNCIVATAPSKTFNLAGLQTANLIIPNPSLRRTWRESFDAVYSDWNLPALGGKACELAYTRGAPGWTPPCKKYKKTPRFSKQNSPQPPIARPPPWKARISSGSTAAASTAPPKTWNSI
jgi:bifunctional pyridoxal-dependent enzyme with beta-cystathionase and maltose regulon repressor activities